MENKSKLQIMPPSAGYYPVDDIPVYIRKIQEITKPKERKLRTDLKKGMVCIVTDGQFIGKRVFYIANKSQQKEKAVCIGPASINNVRMFSIDERLLFKTSLVLEMSSFNQDEIEEIADCDMSFIQCDNSNSEIETPEIEKRLETALIQQISKTKYLKSYLQTPFTMPKGDPLSLDY